VFDYWDYNNAVIMVEDSAIPMVEWVKKHIVEEAKEVASV